MGFGPAQGGGGGGGGGFVSPATEDLDMDGFDLLDVGALNASGLATFNGNVDLNSRTRYLESIVLANTATSGSPENATAYYVHYVNTGGSEKNYVNLPVPVYGQHYRFTNRTSFGLRITANTGCTIRMGHGTSASAGYVETVLADSTLHLVAIDDTTWEAHAVKGTWRIDSTSSAGFAYTPTAWTSFTPTGLWDNTTYFGRYQQLGNRLHIYFYLTITGTPTSAAQFYLDTPSGFTIDEPALNTPYNARVGDGLYVDEINTGQFAALSVHFLASSDNKLYPYTSAVPAVAVTKSAPAAFSSDYRLQFNVTIPVQ